ncbi:MAG: hypothetical protein COA62_09900 [Rhodobiaceae bacterium]|nr:MAG: hypothetical protein COA62_09900 [Rhodobiaceae bacterium]
MTLVVCKKIGNDLVVHSDSKVIDEFSLGTEREQRQNSPLTGLLKTVILHPNVTVSFAGKSEYATDFLEEFLKSDLSQWNTKKLLNKLFEVHRGSENEVDFIVCTSFNSEPIVHIIKEGGVRSNLENAWIGSQPAFEHYQKIYHTLDVDDDFYKSRTAFQAVIDSTEFEEVGHFHVVTRLDHKSEDNESVYLYDLKVELDTGGQKTVIKAGERKAIPWGSAEHGAYGTSYFRSYSPQKHGVAIHFPHASFGILMCPQVNCKQPILIRNVSGQQFVNKIFEDYALPMEGFAVHEETRLKLIRPQNIAQ